MRYRPLRYRLCCACWTFDRADRLTALGYRCGRNALGLLRERCDADRSARSGLDARIAVLDARIAVLDGRRRKLLSLARSARRRAG